MKIELNDYNDSLVSHQSKKTMGWWVIDRKLWRGVGNNNSATESITLSNLSGKLRAQRSTMSYFPYISLGEISQDGVVQNRKG